MNNKIMSPWPVFFLLGGNLLWSASPSVSSARDLTQLSLQELGQLEVSSIPDTIPASASAVRDPLSIAKIEGSVWLIGDSTLHPFSSRTSTLQFSTALDFPKTEEATTVWDAILRKDALKKWELTIPVKTLKSKESSLDKNMYKALKAEDYSEIRFRLSAYEVVASTGVTPVTKIKATGTLTIAGQDRHIVLWVDATSEETGLHLQGQYTLKMSDYGIKPPTLLMGTIKVRDPIEVHFDLRLQ